MFANLCSQVCTSTDMYKNQDQLGLMLVLPVLFLSILIIINIIALISLFIKHIMSQSDVIRYQLQAWLPCLSGMIFKIS